MMDLYGITQCSTVKKARVWLEENGVPYTFHDFKKEPLSETWLLGCLKQVDLTVLLNKRGTTWRRLSAEQQAQAQQIDNAIALMCTYPSLIKRPILWHENQLLFVGFSPEDYAAFFRLPENGNVS